MKRMMDILVFYMQRPYWIGMIIIAIALFIVPGDIWPKIDAILITIAISFIVTVIDYWRLRRRELGDDKAKERK